MRGPGDIRPGRAGERRRPRSQVRGLGLRVPGFKSLFDTQHSTIDFFSSCDVYGGPRCGPSWTPREPQRSKKHHQCLKIISAGGCNCLLKGKHIIVFVLGGVPKLLFEGVEQGMGCLKIF